MTETQSQMSVTFIEKYLNIGIRESLQQLFSNAKPELSKSTILVKPESNLGLKNYESYSKILEDITNYQTLYKQKLQDREKVKEYLFKYITSHVDNSYNKINVQDADINYFLKGVCESYDEKFKSIIQKMDINHIIKMIDYTNEKNEKSDISTYKTLMNMYFKLFGDKILSTQFGKSNNYLFEQINDNWSSINFENLLNFSDVLSKLKYYKADTSKYDLLFNTKFDSVENIQKILDFINKNYLSSKPTTSTISDINETQKQEWKNDDLKYNFRFIIDNLKSNGFLLFEQYYKNIQSRYEQISIEMLNRDLKLTNHFMSIISQNEQTNVNRYVNDMLIRTRNYLFDLQESYHNNQTYQKIKIRAESDKYKNEDISKYNRELTNFKILKYNYCTNSENILARAHTLDTPIMLNTNGKFSEATDSDAPANNLVIDYKNISKNLAGYFDMYRSYYKTRYPDREVEYDLINSTIIVKMKFDEKPYYIHMALIQYIVLDKIMEKPEGANVQDISESIKIPLSKLNETFNSLLKIKIAKRTSGTINTTNIKFILNKDFTFEKNKLSICGLVKKEISEAKPTQREFLHDRDMIVLCNLVHYAKKNTYFSKDTIMEELRYKIPFRLTEDIINKAIEKAVKDDYVKLHQVPNANGVSDVLYQYSDE
jgi:hypothetical protein